MSKSEVNSEPLTHPTLVGTAASLLIATLATDFFYSETLLYQWNNFSIWLLAAGLIVAAVAGLALLFDVASKRLSAIAWDRFIGFTAAALIALLNAFVHSRDAYTAVVPDGLVLSAVTAVILVFLGRRDWSLRAVPRSSLAKTMEFHANSTEVQL